MKKFILGFLCGMALFAATAAASSSKEVKALISSISVYFHVNGEFSSLSADETHVLNYQGHLYVPLRSFAEQMGGAVYYKPSESGSGAIVNVFYEDDRDLPLTDKDGYVRIGHTETSLSEDRNLSSVQGTIKLMKSIPHNQDIVMVVLDEKKREVGISKPLHLQDKKIAQLGKGDIAQFNTVLPYRDYPENYQLEVRIVNKTDWTYSQYESGAVVDGAGGVNGFPLAVRLGGSNTNPRAGVLIDFGLELLNLDEQESYTINKPVTFDIMIRKEGPGESSIVRTLTTKPFTGIVEWKKGLVFTTVEWDGKDDKGKPVPPGEYYAEVKMPVKAEGFANGKPDQPATFNLETSMQVHEMIIVE